MSSFDAVAPSFDRHRALPEGAAKAICAAVLAALAPHPRLLDLGAGSGRIGWPLVIAAADYIGVDLSYGMLRTFKDRAATAALVQADGCELPFRQGTFDAVLLVQIFGGLKRWRALIDETLRVLKPGGALLLGRILTPDDGIDAAMKRQLAAILSEQAAPPDQQNTREQAERQLEAIASAATEIEATHWPATRRPRDFIERHAGGAQFSKWPPDIRARALRTLSDWAVGQFGGLDAGFTETHRFTLRIFKFAER